MIKSFLQYIEAKKYSQNTITSYNHDLQQFAQYLQDMYRLAEPTYADYNMVRSWILQLTEDKANAASINRKMATLKSFFKYLQQEKIISKNPAQRLKPLKVSKKKPVYIDESKLVQLLGTLQYPSGFEGKRSQLILELLYGTGIRLSELLALKLEDVDFQAFSIKVIGTNVKDRNISLSEPLIELLKQYEKTKQNKFGKLNHSHIVVTENGKPAYPMLVYRIVKKYLELITDQEKKSPQVLRHSFAMHLLNKGADLHAIKDLLGHTSLSATQVYSHNSLDQIKEIFNQAHPKA